jgi:hypothetical protein
MLMLGCGDSRENSFGRLVADKEKLLKGMVKLTARPAKVTCEHFGHGTDGDRGMLRFDVVTAVPDVLGVRTTWKAEYAYQGGNWEFVSSERAVEQAQGPDLAKSWRYLGPILEQINTAIAEHLR